MPSIHDTPENITGLSGILNVKKIKRGINPTNVEQEMLRNFRDTSVATDALSDYKREMKRIQEDTGMDFGENWDVDDLVGDKPGKDVDIEVDDDAIFGKDFGTKKDPVNYNHELNRMDRNISKPREQREPREPREPRELREQPHFKGQSTTKFNNRQEPTLFGGATADDSDSDDNFWNFDDKRPANTASKRDPLDEWTEGQQTLPREKSNDMRYSVEKQKYTKDQIQQRNIQRFMTKIDASEEDDGSLFKQVEEEDEKQRLLTQIEQLREMLEGDDVDISHIPIVNNKSEMKDIKDSYKMLLTKNDTRRCSSMAEEGILMMAYALEDIFDGKRVLFGRFRPNLSGWHSTAQTKLKRMRFETANVVSRVMQSYGIGDVGRIGLELIPSMVIYSKRKQNSANEPDLQDTSEFIDAVRDLKSDK